MHAPPQTASFPKIRTPLVRALDMDNTSLSCAGIVESLSYPSAGVGFLNRDVSPAEEYIDVTRYLFENVKKIANVTARNAGLLEST